MIHDGVDYQRLVILLL